MLHNEKINLHNVFRLDVADVGNVLHVKPVKNSIWEPYRIDVTILTKGEVVPRQPIEFAWSSGKKAMDHIGTERPAIHLFSSRVFECFRDCGFSGWSTFPVIIYDKDNVCLDGYQGLVVRGRCGAIDDSKSIRTVLPGLRPGLSDRPAMVGLYFDPSTWDGSDIFTPNGRFVFVVERVKHALERIGVENIRFERITDMENLTASIRLHQKK